MKTDRNSPDRNIDSLSFDNFLSMSREIGESQRYGQYCCIMEIDKTTIMDMFRYPISIDAYIFVVCSDGLIELTCNLFRLTLQSRSMFLYNPGAIINISAVEPSRLHLMIFTREFIDELGIKIDNIPLQYSVIRKSTTIPLTEKSCEELRSMMAFTADLIKLDNTNPNYGELVRSSFKTFIYRALYVINDIYGTDATDMLPSQENHHFDRFMRLLEENYSRHRSIRFYSEAMNLSPKYLSQVIKKASGRVATAWIDDFVILEAKNLLKYSSMSIQEISYALNFPNQSFFGKYFKRHTGLSPKTYRAQP